MKFVVLLLTVSWRELGNAIPHRRDEFVSHRQNESQLHSNHYTKSIIQLFPREQRELCAPPVYDPNNPVSYKRAIFDGNGTTLWRRMILPEDGKMEEFMMEETQDKVDSDSLTQFPVIWDAPDRYGDTVDFNTASFEEFKHYPNRELSFITRGLKGCTLLAVISRKAVYFAHYWETISFLPDFEFREKYKTEERLFEATVIKGLKEGVGVGARKQQASLKGGADKIDDDTIQAYLMRPSKGWKDEPDPYRKQWDLIMDTVGEILPKLAGRLENERWHEIQYEATSDKTLLKKSSRGRTLFKYDPKHKETEDARPRKQTKFWTENIPQPHHDDHWDEQQG